MRVRLTGAEEVITCSVVDGTISHRHTVTVPPREVTELTRAVAGTLARAARARALAATNHADLRQLGEALYRKLLPPELRELLGAHQGPLLLELDESLVPWPWELLFDGEQFFCRRYDLGRTVTTQQPLRGQPARTVGVPARMLVIAADPAGDLPGVGGEAASLVAAMDRHGQVHAHLMADADPATLSRSLKEFDLVHFAGHADYCAKEPEASGWRLRDGCLSARQVVELAGGAPLPLLVFSHGCRSSDTDAWDADEPTQLFGLSNAFLLAGVRYYLGPRSDVVDGAGRRFAAAFWGRLAEGAPVGLAVRGARDAVAQALGEESLAWAPYVLYGDPAGAPLARAETAPARAAEDLLPRPSSLASRPSMPHKRVAPPKLARRGHRAGRRRVVVSALVGVVLIVAAAGVMLYRALRPPAPSDGQPRTVALLGIGTATSLEGGAEHHAAALESCLLATLARHPYLRLVDRARIRAFVRGRAGVGRDEASEVGRELSADFVIYGDVAVVSGQPFFTVFGADPSTHQVIFSDGIDGFRRDRCQALGRRIAYRLVRTPRPASPPAGP